MRATIVALATFVAMASAWSPHRPERKFDALHRLSRRQAGECSAQCDSFLSGAQACLTDASDLQVIAACVCTPAVQGQKDPCLACLSTSTSTTDEERQTIQQAAGQIDSGCASLPSGTSGSPSSAEGPSASVPAAASSAAAGASSAAAGASSVFVPGGLGPNTQAGASVTSRGGSIPTASSSATVPPPAGPAGIVGVQTGVVGLAFVAVAALLA